MKLLLLILFIGCAGGTALSILVWFEKTMIIALISFSATSLLIVSLLFWKYSSKSMKIKLMGVVLETMGVSFLIIGYSLDISTLMWCFIILKLWTPMIVYFMFPYGLDGLEDSVWCQSSLLTYITFSKIWGVLVMYLLPLDDCNLLLLNYPMMLMLLIFQGKGMKEFYMSVIVLDGVVNMGMLAGGVGYKNMLLYIVCSFVLHMGSFKMISGNINFCYFYCFLTSVGMPAFPMVIVKYVGIMGVYGEDLPFFMLLTITYGVYLASAMFYVSDWYLKDKKVSVYLVVCMCLAVFNCLGVCKLVAILMQVKEDLEFSIGCPPKAMEEGVRKAISDKYTSMPWIIEVEYTKEKDALLSYKQYDSEYPDGLMMETLSADSLHLNLTKLTFTYVFPEGEMLAKDSPLWELFELPKETVSLAANPYSYYKAVETGMVHKSHFKKDAPWK